MTRTDIHRPSAPEFDPEAYRCVGVFDLFPEWPNPEASRQRLLVVNSLIDQGFRFGGGSGGCGHCGANIRYAALMVHEESREILYVGETCLSNRFEALTKSEFAALRKSAALNRERVAKSAKIEALVAEHPALAWLTYPVAIEDSSFLSDVADRFRRYGDLSERQIAAVEKALVQDTERRAAREARDAEAAALAASGVKVPEGRVTIEGEVVSTRYMEPYAYGAAGTWKMLVVADEGWKVWATVCSSFYTPERNGVVKGDRVRFLATIKPSDDDPLFGFASRPTKGEVL